MVNSPVQLPDEPEVASALKTGANPASQRCRFCDSAADTVVVDLGSSPLANSYLEPEDLLRPEVAYPLRAVVCSSCTLVQLPTFESAESIFSDYAYFSSFSDSWLRHAERFVERATSRFALDHRSLVVEVASNDGYLLQYFERAGIPILGIEPARNVAQHAVEKGIPSLCRFLGEKTARAIVERDTASLRLGDDVVDRSAAPLLGRSADLLVGNNVFAHVPALNDFTRGLRRLLAPRGVLSLEFPHLLRLLEEVQFDTIYHEHFSYFSFTTACRVLARHGLEVFDVEELPTHGGSLRVFARRSDADPDDRLRECESVEALQEKERSAGLLEPAAYETFGERVRALKLSLLRFLLDAKKRGKRVVAYGAPAKGNTLLNYCGIDRDLVSFTVDRSPHKQGRFLPGSRIPIYEPARLLTERPDFVLILPWNLKEEIASQMAEIKEWGGRFVVAVPEVEVLEGR